MKRGMSGLAMMKSKCRSIPSHSRSASGNPGCPKAASTDSPINRIFSSRIRSNSCSFVRK